MGTCPLCGEATTEIDSVEMCGARFCSWYNNISQNSETVDLEYHRKVMWTLKRTEERIKYLLEKKPKLRNLDDWDFLCKYWEYFLGFLANSPFSKFYKSQIKKYALPETVRRAHQLVCEGELAVVRETLKQLDSLVWMSPEFNSLFFELKKQLAACRYLPTDVDLLRKKFDKEGAILELVVYQKS